MSVGFVMSAITSLKNNSRLRESWRAKNFKLSKHKATKSKLTQPIIYPKFSKEEKIVIKARESVLKGRILIAVGIIGVLSYVLYLQCV